jgi:hypothetical protein
VQKRRSGTLVLLAVMLCASIAPGRAAAPAAAPIESGCGVAGGTLTMVATDNESDFASFALLDQQGDEMARQFIPTYSQDASAELMLTQFGFGTAVSSVKCLADSSLRRCADPKWPQIDEGVGVAVAGVLLGPDWLVVSVKGHYVNLSSPIAGSLDGSTVGFQLDADSVRWSSLYDSQTEASQAYFAMKSGAHTLTIGSRNFEKDALVPQDRLCFNT